MSTILFHQILSSNMENELLIQTKKVGGTPISDPYATQEDIAKYTAEKAIKAIKKDLKMIEEKITEEINNIRKQDFLSC